MGGSWGHVAMESMPFGTLFFMRYVFGAVGNERLGRASLLSCLWRNCKTKRERENVPRGSGASFSSFLMLFGIPRALVCGRRFFESCGMSLRACFVLQNAVREQGGHAEDHLGLG